MNPKPQEPDPYTPTLTVALKPRLLLSRLAALAKQMRRAGYTPRHAWLGRKECAELRQYLVTLGGSPVAITASGEVYGEAKPGIEVSVEGIEVWVGTGVTVHQDDSMASGIRIEGGATPKGKPVKFPLPQSVSGMVLASVLASRYQAWLNAAQNMLAFWSREYADTNDSAAGECLSLVRKMASLIGHKRYECQRPGAVVIDTQTALPDTADAQQGKEVRP